MAKAQKRGNKEAKKPKAIMAPSMPVATASFLTRGAMTPIGKPSKKS